MFFNSLFEILFFCFRWILISIPHFISLFVCKCPSQIKKLFPVFSVVIFLFLTSCFFSSPVQDGFHLIGGGVKTLPPIERIRPKRPDPVKQGECQRRGRNDCEGEEDCEDICDDIFSRRTDRQDCYEYSLEMVSQFENLISATEDGDVDEIEDIGPEVLECMLDIDEREFAKAIRKMSRREAQDFVVLIAEDEDFADVLEEEDDEFNVLKQLANSLAGSSGLEEALSQEIKNDKTFLWLFSEDNEGAWGWLDSYVDEECDEGDSEDCPGGENIGAYCNALLESGFRKSDWEDFLSDTDLFAEEYKDEVEDEDYEYEITDSPGRDYNGDFRDYCELKAPASAVQPQPPQPQPPQPQPPQPQPPQPQPPQPQPPQPQPPQPQPPQPQPPQPQPPQPQPANPCPTGRPNANQILANFQLEVHTYFRSYLHPDYGSSGNSYLPDLGSASPAQDIVLNITANIRTGYDNLYELVLNEDRISYNRSRIYYIYIDNNRYKLSGGTAYTQNGIRHKRFTPKNYPQSGRLKNIDIAVASELNDDQCEFYTP